MIHVILTHVPVVVACQLLIFKATDQVLHPHVIQKVSGLQAEGVEPRHTHMLGRVQQAAQQVGCGGHGE